ncbi:MAG: ABC transporter ATP-binding protein [Pseudomonadota bacterium]
MVKTLGPVRRGFAPWDDPSAVPLIRFEGVTKRFGDFTAINDVSLDIFEREFFALLGPSGCGKTTLMRLLAGFETPTSGRILLDGKDISTIPPHRRPVNMMFQSYALFPHMNVSDNIAFGLKQEGALKPDIAVRVEEMLGLVKLEPFAKRKPDQLSGGQRQRVALARSLAKRPRVLLLDEPLGALDKKLREETQFELMDLQEKLGMTFLIVTHDQEEAMTVADRIAVMNLGGFEQIAPPAEIYEQPNSRFVAGFVGDINMVEGEVRKTESGHIFAANSVDQGIPLPADPDVGPGPCVMALRPEKLSVHMAEPSADHGRATSDRATSGRAMVKGRVWDIAYMGDVSIFHVRLADESCEGDDVDPSVPIMRVTIANTTRLVERPISWDDEVWLTWPHEAALWLS